MAQVNFKLLTRAQYDALVTAGTVSAATFYRVTETDLSESLYQGSNKLDRNDLDVAEFALASASEGVVTIKGIKEIDGAIAVGTSTANDVTLAKVATTGAAGDVSYSATIGSTTVTNVDDALDALASQSAGGVASKTVYITETAGGSGDAFSKRYGVYQGANGSAASPVVGEKLVDIDIPKDMVVEDGEVVDVVFKSSDNTLHEGSESGTDVTAEIMGSTTPTAANAGKYIKLTIANSAATHLWIPAKDLVDIYTAEQNATQIQLAIDNNNVISATVVAGSIGATELASDAVTTVKILDENVTLAKLSSGVQTSLGLADSAVQSVTASDPTTGTDGTITVDGTEVAVKGLGSAAYTASSAYDPSGSAAAALSTAIGESTDVYTDDTINGAKAYADHALAGALEWEVVSGS